MQSKKKFYITFATLGILNIFFIVFLIYPIFKAVKKNSESILIEKKRIVLLTEEKEDLKKIDNLYNNYQKDLNKIDILFIDPEVPIDFVKFLEDIAQSCQVKIKISSMLKKIEKDDPWENLSTNITIIGSLPNFLKFLEKLENIPYLVEILSFNINQLTEEELKIKEFEGFSLGDIKTSLLMKVYFK